VREGGISIEVRIKHVNRIVSLPSYASQFHMTTRYLASFCVIVPAGPKPQSASDTISLLYSKQVLQPRLTFKTLFLEIPCGYLYRVTAVHGRDVQIHWRQRVMSQRFSHSTFPASVPPANPGQFICFTLVPADLFNQLW
jgi:hypothetical protein